MKKWLLFWLLTSVALAIEFYLLKHQAKFTILTYLQSKNFISSTVQINTQPGRWLSLWLGWTGLGLMIVMNLYSMRKRFSFMSNMGKLSSWLDFHIFCGLLGPTLIFFHCDFKVRGLVGISFWSMVVSFSSGIIGRYFYVQLLRAKVDLENEAQRIRKQIESLLEKMKMQTTESDKNFAFTQALQFVGVPADVDNAGAFKVFMSSIIGDLRLTISQITPPSGWPAATSYFLAQFALAKRKAVTLEQFKKLMGYWHAFHFPFAIFMYVVAVIHVAAALVLGVKNG